MLGRALHLISIHWDPDAEGTFFLSIARRVGLLFWRILYVTWSGTADCGV